MSDTVVKVKKASVWREGQFLILSPPCQALLGPVLRTRSSKCRQGAQGDLRMGRTHEPLSTLEIMGGHKALKFWAGLTPVVLAALHLAGHPVQISGGLLQANLPLAEAKDLPDSQFLEHVALHDRGLIRYDADQVQPARLIAQVAKVWHNLHITAVTSRRDDVYTLVRQLRGLGIDAFGFTARNQPLVETHVAVTTYSGLAFNPIEPTKQDIVISLDAVEATSNHSLWCLSHLLRARLYGLLDHRQHLSRHEDDMVHCLFGFEEMIVPQHGHRLRPVETLWVKGEGRQLQHEPDDELLLKRHGLWHNEARNRQVARLASAFAAGDLKRLLQLLPTTAGSRLPRAASSTFVLVENLEHLLELMPKLPGWPVIASGLLNLEGLTAQQRADLERRLVSPPGFSPNTGAVNAPQASIPECAIVTQTGLCTANMVQKEIDLLLRADGGTGLPGLPVAQLVRPACEQRHQPLLVVDVDDTHHPGLRQRARRRQRAYLASGWPTVGKTLTDVRLRHFLEVRVGLRQKGGRQ
jgi:hypothetical protein